MKRLVCEMCGSTDIVKKDGLFVCESCGVKYSLEEARKMMIEGTVEVTGTVKVDESAKNEKLIDNYLEMATLAIDEGDIEGVLSYCNRILEIDCDNFKAWAFRALVVGLGSTLQDIKIPQAVAAAKRAVSLAPDDFKYDLAATVYDSMKDLIIALFLSAEKLPLSQCTSYYHKVMLQWQSVLTDIPYLSKNIIEAEINDCRNLCNRSASAVFPKKARTVYIAYTTYNRGVSYDKSFEIALSEKIKIEGEREEEFIAKAKAEAEAAEARKAEYWASHIEIKSKLDSDKATAEGRKKELLAELNSFPEFVKANELKVKIDDLTKQINSLGLFNGKEKKAIRSQIDSILAELGPLEEVIAEKNNAILVQINDQDTIIQNIEEELEKER